MPEALQTYRGRFFLSTLDNKRLKKYFFNGEINREDKWRGIFSPSFAYKEESYEVIHLKANCEG